jgi:hypothetical protein
MNKLIWLAAVLLPSIAVADPDFVCQTYKHYVEVKALPNGSYSYSARDKNDSGKIFINNGHRDFVNVGSCSIPEYRFKNGNAEYVVSDSFCDGAKVIVSDRAFVEVYVNGKSAATLGCDKH